MHILTTFKEQWQETHRYLRVANENKFSLDLWHLESVVVRSATPVTKRQELLDQPSTERLLGDGPYWLRACHEPSFDGSRFAFKVILKAS